MAKKRKDVASPQTGNEAPPAPLERFDDAVGEGQIDNADESPPVEWLDDATGEEMYREFKANERADLIDRVSLCPAVSTEDFASAFRLARSWPVRVMTLWSDRVSSSMDDDDRRTLLATWMEELWTLVREFNATNRLFASHRSIFRPAGSSRMRVGHLTFPSATLAGYGILRLFLWRLWDCEDSRRMDDAISDSCRTEFLRNGIAVRCPTDAVIGVRDERGPIDAGFPVELVWMWAPSHLEFLQRLRTEFLEEHGIDESVPSAIETDGEDEQQTWEATLLKDEKNDQEAKPPRPKIERTKPRFQKEWAEKFDNSERTIQNWLKADAGSVRTAKGFQFSLEFIRTKDPEFTDD